VATDSRNVVWRDDSLRCSGRTTRMLMAAEAAVDAGKQVIIVINSHEEVSHVKHTLRMAVKVHRMKFHVFNPAEPLPDGYHRASVFVDHHVIENLTAAMFGGNQ
jgi:hypothetical protein